MKTDPRLIVFARRMRTDPSPTEKLAWRLLRRHRMAGLHFRHQHPIPPYVTDFYCAAAKLVVEVDGESHVGQEENDARRQSFLESQGLKVLRFWNGTVFEEQDSFTTTIYRECVARLEADQVDEWGEFRRRKRDPVNETG